MTSGEIAEVLDRPPSTICAVLKRNGLGKLRRLDQTTIERHERARPGEVIHIDVTSTAGYGTTTVADHTKPSADGHPPPG